MGPVALPHLSELLHHEKAFVRAETLYGLQSYNDDLTSIMPRVIELLADENRYVRRNALKMLIKQGASLQPASASSAIPALLDLMDDHINRNYALMALAEIGEPALPAIEQLLANQETAHYALGVYTNMGPQAAPASSKTAAFLSTPHAVHATKALTAIRPTRCQAY